MNIRKSLEAVLRKYGHDAIYIRRDTRFQCHCYLERNGEADPNCKDCFGLGHPVVLEKIKVRYVVDNNLQRQAELKNNYREGTNVPIQFQYFVKKEVEPKNGDMIYEVKFDSNGKVTRVLNKSFISLAQPMRGSNGRIEFYQVYTRDKRKDRHDDKTVSERNLQTE